MSNRRGISASSYCDRGDGPSPARTDSSVVTGSSSRTTSPPESLLACTAELRSVAEAGNASGPLRTTHPD
eukprot:COSAG01_NODE_9800_length_2340_cov_5.178046_2_plen_70_part_00